MSSSQVQQMRVHSLGGLRDRWIDTTRVLERVLVAGRTCRQVAFGELQQAHRRQRPGLEVLTVQPGG